MLYNGKWHCYIHFEIEVIVIFGNCYSTRRNYLKCPSQLYYTVFVFVCVLYVTVKFWLWISYSDWHNYYCCVKVINLDFTTFSTERLYDIVYIFDGDSKTSPIIFALDGDRLFPPTEIRSSGEAMYVWFTSDFSIVAPGFLATYQSVSASK